VIVTPDAQRTMCTYLGAANRLDPEAVDADLLAAAPVTFVEGYLWDEPQAKDAIRIASDVVHRAGRKFAFTLSDPFCVERHRAEFRNLVENDIDILFANENEITMLYEVDTFDAALAQVRGHCEIAALTRGKNGSVIVNGGDAHVVEPAPTKVVDTTGAGDLYAAGFLYGLTAGHDLPTCGRLASLAAAEVISHIGARPLTSLADLARPLLQD
jgi:sugar/nucleoside kinase (ribokinase family)